MKRLKPTSPVIFIIIVILISVYTCNDDSLPPLKCDNSGDEDSLIALIDRYEYAANTGDLELFLSCFDEDAWRLPPNVLPRKGKDAIRDEMTPVFETMNLETTITSWEECIIEGDYAMSIIFYNIYAWPKGGDPSDRFPIEPDGKVCSVFERQDDCTWKLLYDTMNSNQAAPCD